MSVVLRACAEVWKSGRVLQLTGLSEGIGAQGHVAAAAASVYALWWREAMAFTSTPTATHTHKIHKGSFSPLLFELYFLVPWGVHCMHREGMFCAFVYYNAQLWNHMQCERRLCELHPCKFSDCSSWCHSPSHLLVEFGIEARGHPWCGRTYCKHPHPHRPNMHTHKYSHPLFNQSNRLSALNRYSVYDLFI